MPNAPKDAPVKLVHLGRAARGNFSTQRSAAQEIANTERDVRAAILERLRGLVGGAVGPFEPAGQLVLLLLADLERDDAR